MVSGSANLKNGQAAKIPQLLSKESFKLFSSESNDESCPLGNGAAFCSEITAAECYNYPQLCCKSCPKYFIGEPGKLSS